MTDEPTTTALAPIEPELVEERALARPGPLPRLDRNPALAYIGRLRAESSQVTQRQSLRTAASVFAPGTPWEQIDWSTMRYQHVERIVTELVARKLAPATINRIIMALRGVARESWRLGYLDHNNYEWIKQVKTERVPKQAPGRQIPLRDFAILMHFDGTSAGARDAAIVAVMYGCGLRRAEAAALTLADFVVAPEGAVLEVREGKGRKPRTQEVPPGTVEAIELWLERRGREPGPLFCAVRKGDRIVQGRPISGGAIFRLLKKRVEAAGLRKIAPHDCRRALATDLLDGGADLSQVQQILGHSNVATTVRYDRRSRKGIRAVIDRLNVPVSK